MKSSKQSLEKRPGFLLIAVTLLMLLQAMAVSAKPASEFTTCEALPGLTPVQVMLFTGPPNDDLSNFIMPDSDDGVSQNVSKPPETFWVLDPKGRPYNFVCGYVPSDSKAATDSRLIEPASIVKQITVPIPDDATACSITFDPGPDPGFPNVKKVMCDLKPGSHAPQKPNRS